MSKFYFQKLYLLFFYCLLLAGCSISPQMDDVEQNIIVDNNIRNIELKQLNAWQINGKIAFIQKNKRESASIAWRYDKTKNEQELNLTTVLGINILKLQSNNDIHILDVDGKTYQSDNLEKLIYQLTQLKIPVEGLVYWIKGLPFLKTDSIEYTHQNQLPTLLESTYNGESWIVTFQKYKQIEQYQLATKFSIKQNDLTIKLAINEWSILNSN